MFDYIKFENDIVLHMENSLKKWMSEYDDIYILSLDCSNDMYSIGTIANTNSHLNEQEDSSPEDYWYYKYCEEEWDLWDSSDKDLRIASNKISLYMREYIEKIDGDEFVNHREKIIETCKKALICLKQSINKTYPNLLLTFNIREYLDENERIEIFEMLNTKEAAKEYSEHIEDFC